MLEFEDVGGRGVGEPDGGSICEDRVDGTCRCLAWFPLCGSRRSQLGILGF